MHLRTIGFGLLLGLTSTAASAMPMPGDYHPPRSTGGEVITIKARGTTASAKLSPDLQALFEMMRGARGEQRYSAVELEREFGIKKGDRNASVTVGIKVTDTFTIDNLTRYGGSVLFQVGATRYANIPVAGLISVAKDDAVVSIAPVTNKQLPSPTGGRVKLVDVAGIDASSNTVASGIAANHDGYWIPDSKMHILAVSQGTGS